MTIDEIQNEIIEDFTAFDDWMDRYNLLIDLGKELPEIDPKYKTGEYLIEGCQSKVWIHAEMKDGLIHFTADSDAIITKGIISLLIKVLNKRTPKEILDTDLKFIEAIGLQNNLSPTRANGLLAMIKQIKLYAMAYQAKNENE